MGPGQQFLDPVDLTQITAYSVQHPLPPPVCICGAWDSPCLLYTSGVKIADSALIAAATLSDRYITDRFLPDKAIDLVDEACAMTVSYTHLPGAAGPLLLLQ